MISCAVGGAYGIRTPEALYLSQRTNVGSMTIMSRALILFGLVLVVVGLLWSWLGRLGLGRLPGDIWIEREKFTLYVPVTTGILISIVLSLLLWLIGR